MKKGWQTKTLGDLCDDVEYGSSAKSKADGGVPVLRMGNIQDGRLDWENLVYTDDKAEIKKYLLKHNDVLFNRTNSPELVGKTAIYKSEMPAIFAGYLIRIHRKEDLLDGDYLTYFLNSELAFDYGKTVVISSVNQANINGTKLKSYPIPAPSLAEQQRIVGLLDEAFAGLATAKANAEKNLQNARALFASHLQSVFTQRGPGWVETPFSELCDIKHGYAFDGEFFSSEGEYVLLTPGNFYERGGYRDRGEKQKYYTGEIPRDYVLNEGDLLVAMTEQAAGLLGSPILVPESDKFLHNQRLGLVTKKPGVAWTNEFFFHVFNTQPVRKAIHASASGVKVRHTSPTKIGDVVVAFPTSLSEQKCIVTTLASLSEETQRLARLYERKLAALEALKKSLLHQAFTGAL